MSSSPNTPTSRPKTPKSAKTSRASSKGSKRSKSSKGKKKKERKKKEKKDKKKQNVDYKEPGTKVAPDQSEPLQSVKPATDSKPVLDTKASDTKPATAPADTEPKSARSDPKLTASDVRLKPSDPKPAESKPSQPGSGTDTDASQQSRPAPPRKKAPVAESSSEWLYILFFITETLGLSIIVLTIAWIYSFGGGFTMKGPTKLKAWHPFLMIVGPIYLMANSLLTYQLILKKNKPNLKKAHMLINSLALICVVASQITLAMDSCEKVRSGKKNEINEPFYSLHAWIGVLGIIIFFVQYVLEAIMFFFPNTKIIAKLRMAKTNVILGVSSLFVSSVACISGYVQQMMEQQKSWATRIFPGSERSKNEEIVVNTIGLLTVLFICMSVYLVFHQTVNKSKKSGPSRSASKDKFNRDRARKDPSQPLMGGQTSRNR